MIKYFKVVRRCETKEGIILNFPFKESIVDTSQINYSLTLDKYEKQSKFSSYLVSSSSRDRYGFDFYYQIYKKIIANKTAFFDLINTTYFTFPDGTFSIKHLTLNENYDKEFIDKSQLLSIIDEMLCLQLPESYEGFYLWEYIFEKVRFEKYANLPSRLNSFFLFENISDCVYFEKTHANGGLICEVELIKTISLFKGDMKLFDLIPEHFSFHETKKVAEDYWSQNVSDKPIYETLFNGLCKLVREV